jgi:aryl-alcohol dehydrogenase-like predicted oxidoreductase
MDYRLLGRTGLLVSTFGFGTTSFDGHPEIGKIDDEGAFRQIAMALDAGVNLFDTADAYGGGRCEELLGKGLGRRRDDAVIATKLFVRTGPGPNDVGLSRKHIVTACEASLRRLQTDYIDLLQTHGWDGVTPLEETLSAFDDLVQAGKVRYVGVSNYSAWHLMKALGISDQRGLARYASQQIHYSLQAREAEYELIPLAIDQGVAVLVWSPLGGGLLSGKWRRDRSAPLGSRRMEGWPDPPIYDEEQFWEIIDALLEVAEEYGASPAQVALAYIRDKPGITSVILGARTDDQLVDNLGAMELALDDAARRRLDQASAPRLIYPYWWQAKYDERLGPADLAVLEPYVAVPKGPGSEHRDLPGFGLIPGTETGDVNATTGRA